MSVGWTEARLRKGAYPTEVYDFMGSRGQLHHHFFGEPWWEDRYVVRVYNAPDLTECPAVDHTKAWDSEPDEEQYGEDWEAVADYFRAASNLGDLSQHRRAQLIHCFLNSQGLSWTDESRLMAKMAWKRLLLCVKWPLYLKRRWERQQRENETGLA